MRLGLGIGIGSTAGRVGPFVPLFLMLDDNSFLSLDGTPTFLTL